MSDLAPDRKMTEGIAGAGAVEIKVTVSEKKEKAAEKAFGLDPQKGEQRHIFFFDTRKLQLLDKGVILRAREVKGGKDDSTVKIRPVAAEKIANKFHLMEGFKVEADGVANRLICSASLSVAQRGGEIRDVASRKRPFGKLFSIEQEGLLLEMSPIKVDFTSLAILGPVDALRWNFQHPGLGHSITAENWRLPDGRDLLEVSIKVPMAQAGSATAAFHAFLNELDLQPQGGQETKTRVALEFFAKQTEG